MDNLNNNAFYQTCKQCFLSGNRVEISRENQKLSSFSQPALSYGHAAGKLIFGNFIRFSKKKFIESFGKNLRKISVGSDLLIIISENGTTHEVK